MRRFVREDGAERRLSDSIATTMRHDEAARTQAQIRGFAVFRDPKKGNCESCHAVGEKYALFTDNKFHNIGVGFVGGVPSDKGRYVVTHQVADTGSFRTPTLRNVELTAPYMHDGSLKDMKQVMDFYIGGLQFESIPG